MTLSKLLYLSIPELFIFPAHMKIKFHFPKPNLRYEKYIDLLVVRAQFSFAYLFPLGLPYHSFFSKYDRFQWPDL